MPLPESFRYLSILMVSNSFRSIFRFHIVTAGAAVLLFGLGYLGVFELSPFELGLLAAQLIVMVIVAILYYRASARRPPFI